MLTIHAFAHFLVDAICAATLLGNTAPAELLSVLLVYNTLAFSTQCLVGLVTDRVGNWGTLSAAACALLGICALLPLPAMGTAVCLGLCNSFFHVAAGSVTLARSGGRAGLLGLFVAPGAVGLLAGRMLPGLRPLLAALLLIAAVLLYRKREFSLPEKEESACAPRAEVSVLLLLAVAARSIGGTAAFFPWQTTAAASAAAVLFVFAGKAAGGWVCDRLGAGYAALLSLPVAGLLIAFCGGSMPLSLLGQLMLNLSMPITLWLIYREMPSSPGFAFGLAASVLWPAQLVGQQIAEREGPRWLWILLSFALGLFAIFYTVKGGKTREETA